MKSSIFAEGSRTAAIDDNPKNVKDYFEGLFNPVKKLENHFVEHSETELHILSDELGYLRGETSMESATDSANDTAKAEEQFKEAILSAAIDSDVIVVLLSSSTFQNTIAEIWPELIDNVRKDSIWCFGAAATALNSVDLTQLESRVADVIVYQRVGVAPIGEEARAELLRAVEQRQTAEGF